MAETHRSVASHNCFPLRLALPAVAALGGLLACKTSMRENKVASPSAQLTSASRPDQMTLFYGSLAPSRPEAHQGLLWFPFVWKPQLIQPKTGSGLTPIESLFIREPKLVFVNNQTKAETLIAMRRDGSENQQVLRLEQGKTQTAESFYLPRVIALSSGEYSVSAIRAEIGHGDLKSGVQVDLPFVNPFRLSASKPLVFTVKEGKLAALARVVQTTSLSQSVQGVNLQSESESIDHDVVPADMVVQHAAPLFASEPAAVLAATPDFPILRLDLTDHNAQPAQGAGHPVQVGFLLDVPCPVNGTMKLVWKKVDDDREFLTQFSINPAQPDCSTKQTLGFTAGLPHGDWLLKSSMISEKNTFEPDLQTSWLKSPDEVIKSYFELPSEPFRWTLETIKEREIQRPMLIQVASLARRYDELRSQQDYFNANGNSGKNGILFLGHFEIRNIDKRKDKLKAHDLETFLKRSFELQTAATLLGSSQVYNAYTLERLTRSRGVKVNTVIRTSTDESDLVKIKPAAAEFRRLASSASATCLTAREESDPLVSLDGELRFTVLKGADSVTLKKIKIGQAGFSDKWIQSCLEKKLLSFRFAEKAPASFQGELRFSNE